MKKIISILLCVLMSFLTLSSCGNSENKRESQTIDDTVSIKLPVSRMDSFNPYFCETDYNSEISSLLYDGLVRIQDDLSYKNAVASGINQNENSISATIRGDAFFSDNTRVTSSDVLYSFNIAKKSPNYEKKLENFESCTTAGDISVSFTLKENNIFAVNCLDFPIIKSPKQSSKDDEKLNEDESKSTVPTGCGRYKFEDETYETLTLNEYWYGEDLPHIRKIKLVNLIDTNAAVNSMETGNISYLFQDLSSGVYNRVNAFTSKILMTNLVYLGINSFSKCLTKPEARQAIMLVIDREKIVENSFLSNAKATNTPFYPNWKELGSLYFDKRDFKEDLHEANMLLDKAGYLEKDSFSMRTSDDVKLKLLVNSDNAYKVAAANEIAESLKAVGITVAVSSVSFEDYKTKLGQVDYDLYIGEVKLPDDMSLNVFFGENGAATYGINKDADMVSVYKQFRAGKITLQRFVDYFNVYLPFIPICYRFGIASYTNEMTYKTEGTHSDIYNGIYTWEY